MMKEEINSKQLSKLMLEKAVTIIDVREPDEYAEGHLKGSVNIPVSVVIAGVIDFRLPKNKEITTICAHGHRSLRMQQLLEKRGFKVRSLAGGVTEWEREFGTKSLIKIMK